MTKRRSFNREFKFEVVRLLESGEKKAADLARNRAKWAGVTRVIPVTSNTTKPCRLAARAVSEHIA